MRPINEVPNKITAIVKRDSKITQQQMALIIIPIVVYVVFMIFLLKRANQMIDTDVGLAIAAIAIVTGFITIRVVMRWGFNEKKLYSEYMQEKTMDVKKCWGILDIREDGKIMYSNGHSAYVVKMERSNIIGRPEDFETTHFANVTVALRQFITMGYLIKKYSLATTDDNSETFSWLDKQRQTLENKKLKAIVGDILKYSKSLSVGTCNRYVEYWLIYAKDQRKDHLGDIKKVLSELKMTLYKPEVLKSAEVYRFITDFFKLKYIDFRTCFYHNINPKQVLTVVKDNIRYKQKSKGLFDPIDIQPDTAAQNYTNLLKKLKDE